MNLAEYINENEIVILDGGMGTQLEAAGSVMGGKANLTNPDAVLGVHRSYSEAGCNILTANTFAMSRVYIESHNLDIDVREVNLKGVALAKEAANPGQFVLGDIGSMGKLLKPYGPISEQDAFDTFCEQASILAGAGVDGYIIETMIDLKEALSALKACKKVSDLPAIVSIAFTTSENEGKTVMGNSARECAKALTEAGAYAIGANCGGIDPFQMATIIAIIKGSTPLPVLAMPNAGKPRVVNKKTMFDMAPKEYLKGVQECVKAGAKMIGGCCGTTPAHIKALTAAFSIAA